MPENEKQNQILHGRTLSSGFGEGTTWIYRDTLSRIDESYDISESEVATEKANFQRALTEISGDLKSLAGRVEEEMDSDLSTVFGAHLTILQYPDLVA